MLRWSSAQWPSRQYVRSRSVIRAFVTYNAVQGTGQALTESSDGEANVGLIVGMVLLDVALTL